MTSTEQPAGYDTRAVEAWIAQNVTGLTPPFTWIRLQGGHSNLTYRLQDAQGRSAVIRRPPMGELLPMAHDMAREWAVIRALAGTPVPVPPAYGFCDVPSVTGARLRMSAESSLSGVGGGGGGGGGGASTRLTTCQPRSVLARPTSPILSRVAMLVKLGTGLGPGWIG